MTEQRKGRLKQSLLGAISRLMQRNADFAAPLREKIYVATKEVKRISTNGSYIWFDPDWLQQLNELSLEFILAHQEAHIALGHIDRPQYYRGDRFHLACDIVANGRLDELGFTQDYLPKVGRIYRETFFPQIHGSVLTAMEALHGVPFDPALLSPSERRNYRIDSDFLWDRKQEREGKGVVILTPDEFELIDGGNLEYGDHCVMQRERDQKDPVQLQTMKEKRADTEWKESVLQSLKELRTLKADVPNNEASFTERCWFLSEKSNFNWQRLLELFVSKCEKDYSFTPPDNRHDDAEFYLPAFNDSGEEVQGVWFMVDTSGSVDEAALSLVYAELFSAISSVKRIRATLGFFDTRVHSVMPLENYRHLKKSIPLGGGCTDFSCVFSYLAESAAEPPRCIVIFTDGRGEFPNRSVAGNLPVLWLFTDDGVKAPWGQSAYIGR